MEAVSKLVAEHRSVIKASALTAGLAYLNARWHVSQDLWLLSQGALAAIEMKRREKNGTLNLFYVLERHARTAKSANRPFLVIPADAQDPTQRTEWTYREAYDTVLTYARWLKEAHNVQSGDVVAIDITNRPVYIWVWFALWSLGAQAAFINTNLRGKGFVHCARISGARLLLVDHLISDVLDSESVAALAHDSGPPAIRPELLTPDLEQHISITYTPYRAPDSARSGDILTTTALLIYTSGTTGLPKAARIPWGKILTSHLIITKFIGMRPDDRYFTSLPLYHSTACLLAVGITLGCGCTVILAPKFSARTVMKTATETKATAMQYIGEMCRYLLSAPPSPYDRAHNLRLAFGNGMRPDVWQRFRDRYNIPHVCELYGATEAPTASIVSDRSGFVRGAVGHQGALVSLLTRKSPLIVKHDHETELPYRDIKTNFCQPCKANEAGEVLYYVDPANISENFQGYVGNAKANEGKIIRDVLQKGDAYYRSGDLLKCDDERRWWFVDRIGDTFRWRGENVSTAEVSAALGMHPAISEANVYGVELPNHDGRAGCAAIGLVEGQTEFDARLRREVAALARKSLPKYAVPLFLRLSKEGLEVTGTVKHQKVELRKAGVDPERVSGDELYWLPPGADGYEPFGKKQWQAIVGGSAKL